MMLTIERDERQPDAQYVLARAADIAAYRSLLAQDVLWSFMQRVPVRVEAGRQRIDYGSPGHPINPRFI